MDGQGVIVNELSPVVPQKLQQHIARHYAFTLHEQLYDLVLRQRQGQRLAVVCYLHPCLIHGKMAALCDLRFSGIAEQDPDAAQKLLHPKWLCHIVVSAGIERAHHVELLVLNGEKKDWPLLACGPPLFAEGDAVTVRQSDVQHDGLHGRIEILLCLAHGSGFEHTIPFPGKQLCKPAAQDAVVLHQQQCLHPAHLRLDSFRLGIVYRNPRGNSMLSGVIQIDN